MKLPLLAAGSLASLALLISSLNAADAPAPASGSAAAPASMAPALDLSKLPKASDKKDLTFEKDVLPILKVSCSGCHIGGGNPRSGLDLGTLAVVLKGGSKMKDKAAVAGHSDQSYIVLYAGDIVKGKEMPPLSGRTAHPVIKPDDLGIIRAWIDQGAKGGAAAPASAAASGMAKPAAASASAS